jgi:hypothetical protein
MTKKKSTGVKSALRIAMDSTPPPPPAARQLPLLAPPEPVEAAGPKEPPRGPGRPPGSINRRTKDFADYLLKRYADPREVLAVMYSRTPAQFAAEIGIKKPSAEQLIEIIRLQKSCAEAVAPYVASKMPVAVEVSSKGIVQLVIERAGEKAQPMGAAADRIIDVTPIAAGAEEKQGKSDD